MMMNKAAGALDRARRNAADREAKRIDREINRIRQRQEAARATPEVIARATAHAVDLATKRQVRRMARYVMDGWTPGLLRALATAAARAGVEHWQEQAIRTDADTLECYLTAQGLAGKKP